MCNSDKVKSCLDLYKPLLTILRLIIISNENQASTVCRSQFILANTHLSSVLHSLGKILPVCSVIFLMCLFKDQPFWGTTGSLLIVKTCLTNGQWKYVSCSGSIPHSMCFVRTYISCNQSNRNTGINRLRPLLSN